MDGKQLKNSILQWAIQGKLVPQNPKDEPAQKLLERIAASRNGDVSPWSEAIGSSKNSKKSLSTSLRGPCKGTKQSKNPPSRIYRENGVWYEQIGTAAPKDISDEIPFEIPESWAWCRLGEMGNTITGSTPSKLNPEYIGSDIPFLSPGDISLLNKIISYDSQGLSLLGKSVARPVPPQTILQVCIGGSIGKCAVVDREVCFNQQINSITLEEIDYKYVYEVLQSKIFQDLMKSKSTGTATPIINKGAWDLLMFPLPPLAEQKRIVAKLEQVLPLAEEYGAAQEQLDKLNKELPEALKKSILQEAIQGKLVPQNPKDEPAQKLLERITAARSEGSQPKGAKSKKSAPTSRIYCENGTWYEQIGNTEPKDISEDIPFEIPENWIWCRWGDLSDSIQYGYNAPALESGRIKMVRISDIHDNKIEWDNVPYCQIKETEIPTYLLKKNDILFARTGGTVGKSYLVGDVPTEAVYAGYLIRTRYNAELLNPQYLKFFMESSLYWEQLHEGTIATAQPNCNGKTLGKMLLPLPPLAEQKRIVSKLEQLFKVL